MPFVAHTKPELFREGQFDKLLAHLDSLNDRTLLNPIQAPEDVLLRDTGHTMEGNRQLTTLSLKQLCQHTAAGLSVLLADVAGINRRRRDPEACSAITAVKVFNLLVTLRFHSDDGLFNRQLVVDTERNTIDGVLGSNYKYLAHADLAQAASQALEGMPRAVIFDSAALVGRHMTITWRNMSPYFVIGGKLPIYGGYTLTNSEAGECSVSAGMTLLIGEQGVRCVQPLQSSARTAHAGKNFKRRLTSILGSVLAASDRLEAQATQLRALVQYPLNAVSATGEVIAGNRRRIYRRLVRDGVKPHIAQEIINDTLAGTHTGEPTRESLRQASTRTVYDLVLAICDRATTYPYQIRAALEQAAFSLIIKPINSHEQK